MTRPARNGCGGGAAEAAQVSVNTPVTVGANSSVVLPWEHFQTTNQDVFSTQPGPNVAGDTTLQVDRAGAVFVASAVEWEAGAPFNAVANLFMGQFGWIDFLHGEWAGVVGSTGTIDGSANWMIDFRMGAVQAGYNCPVIAINLDAAPHDVNVAFINILWWPLTNAPATVY